MHARVGFSMAEFLIAAAALGLIAAVSVPMFAETFRVSRFDGAARQLVSDIRHARSLALSRGGFYGVHSGRDPSLGDPNLVNSYRIEYSPDGVTWPAASATMTTNPTTVISNWLDLAAQFRGVVVQSVVDGSSVPVGGPIFDAMGASVDSRLAPRPLRTVTITLADASGATKTILVSPSGNVKMP
jgi:hypothetical protein